MCVRETCPRACSLTASASLRGMIGIGLTTHATHSRHKPPHRHKSAEPAGCSTSHLAMSTARQRQGQQTRDKQKHPTRHPTPAGINTTATTTRHQQLTSSPFMVLPSLSWLLSRRRQLANPRCGATRDSSRQKATPAWNHTNGTRNAGSSLSPPAGLGTPSPASDLPTRVTATNYYSGT